MSNTVKKVLADLFLRSLTTAQINDLGRGFDKTFDVRKISGFGDKIGVPTKVAIDCLFDHFSTEGRLMQFLSFVVKRDGTGASGGIVKLKELPKAIEQLHGLNWVYDQARNRFQKDQSVEPTPDWGYLLEGEEHPFCFARIETVNALGIMEENLKTDADRTFLKLREYVTHHVEAWNGRIWSWQSEGGTAAFHGEDSGTMLVMSMISILTFLGKFNLLENELKLEHDLKLRIAAHTGSAVFKFNTAELRSEDLSITGEILANCSNPNSISLSQYLHSSLRFSIASHFEPAGEHRSLRIYELKKNALI